MAKTNIAGIDGAVAAMAVTGAPRVPMDKQAVTSFRNASAEAVGPKSRAKNIGGSSDPIVDGPERAVRRPVSTAGAGYGIRAMIVKPNEPAAGATQASGRTIPSAIKRGQRQSFDGASANFV